MATTHEKLFKMFEAARRLNEALWLSAIDSTYMSVEELAECITKEFGVEISFYYVDVENEHVYAHIERYDNGKTCRIYVVKNIPERFKHPVIAKELCQIVLDDESDWQPDGKDTLQRFAMGAPMEWDAAENAGYRSDILAERLSWELLYPLEMRRKDIETKIPHDIIAQRVRLPVQIVDPLLTPAYMSWCESWWKLTIEAYQALKGSAENTAAE